MKAYLLIEIDPGSWNEILGKLSEMQECREASTVTGPYDIIALVEVNDRHDLDALVQLYGQIEGIERITPSPVGKSINP